MSLDFSVLNGDGTPGPMVSLGVDLHHELVGAAITHGLDRFADFRDYYEDAEIAVRDLQEFAEQISALRRLTRSTDMQRFLDALANLVDHAMAVSQPLQVIAD